MSDSQLPAVIPAQVSGLVAPIVSVDEATQAWEQYQQLTQAILDESDYQSTGKKKFKKKSAWRKYMRFYGLDEDERVTRIEVTRQGSKDFQMLPGVPLGFPLFATAYVVIRSPNGKQWTGYHECHLNERCCAAAFGGKCEKKGWRNHTCCHEGCTGVAHWAHAGDIPATAHTRAKNRAISDAIGAGEVSAEEITDGKGGDQDERAPEHVCPGCGKTGNIIKGKEEWGGGWVCWKKNGGCGWKGQEEPPLERFDDEGDGQTTTPPATKAAAKPTKTEQQLKDSVEEQGKKLFQQVCTLVAPDKKGKAATQDVGDYLRKTLCNADLAELDAFSKVQKLQIVLQEEAREPGAGVKMVQGFAADYRRQVAQAATGSGPAEQVSPPGQQPETKPLFPETKAPIPETKPVQGTAHVPIQGELITRYMNLCTRIHSKDGLKLMNKYLDRSVGAHNVTTCKEEEQRVTFGNIFQGMERLTTPDLQRFIADAIKEEPNA